MHFLVCNSLTIVLYNFFPPSMKGSHIATHPATLPSLDRKVMDEEVPSHISTSNFLWACPEEIHLVHILGQAGFVDRLHVVLTL